MSDERPSPGDSTRFLLDRVAGGDSEALDALYGRFLRPMQRWAHGRLPVWARDLLETDDLVQESLLQSLRGVEAFRPEHSGAFQGYLRRSVLNRIRDEIRKVQRRPARAGTAAAVVDPRPSPVEAAIGAEALERYEAALLALRPGERELILARVELGLTYREVAEACGKSSPDAARMAVSRALVRLAEEMHRAG